MSSIATSHRPVFRWLRQNLNSGYHKCLVPNVVDLATERAADPRLANLDMTLAADVSADPVAIRAYHASAQLVQNVEGGLKPCQTQLPLKLESRYSGRRNRNEISTPKPCCQRSVRALHNRSGGQTNVAAACFTAQYSGTSGEAVRLPLRFTPRAYEAVFPAGFFQIGSARFLIRKKTLNLSSDLGNTNSICRNEFSIGNCMCQTDRSSNRIDALEDSLIRHVISRPAPLPASRDARRASPRR